MRPSIAKRSASSALRKGFVKRVNAQQHGALRNNQGRVNINWQVTGSHFVVHWSEQYPHACTQNPEPRLELNLLRGYRTTARRQGNSDVA
jgi:hypothetical protein